MRPSFAVDVWSSIALNALSRTGTGYNPAPKEMTQLSADSWPGARPQAFASANETCLFRTRPPQLANWSGKAQGTVVTLSAGGIETVMWSRELVNIPVRAFITDDAKHVVTFDTWAKLGYEHALVIYGEQGSVVADYNLEALLSADEIARSVGHTATTRPWLQGAIIAFDANQTTIVMTLQWGKVIRVALSTGKIGTAS
jgi:hypothetical protein